MAHKQHITEYSTKEGKLRVRVFDYGVLWEVRLNGNWFKNNEENWILCRIPKDDNAPKYWPNRCVWCGKLKTSAKIPLIKFPSGHSIHNECIDAMVMALLRNKPQQSSMARQLSPMDARSIFGI